MVLHFWKESSLAAISRNVPPSLSVFSTGDVMYDNLIISYIVFLLDVPFIKKNEASMCSAALPHMLSLSTSP